MTDRELIEAAAKAAGAKLTDYSDRTPDHWTIQHADGVWRAWNPLDDDGDAFRLAIALGFNVMTCGREGPETTEIQIGGAVPRTTFQSCSVAGRYEATRRAIVRAAAEVALRTHT
jgi:hypothetical protein